MGILEQGVTEKLKKRVREAKEKMGSHVRGNYVQLIVESDPSFNTAKGLDKIRNVWHQKSTDTRLTEIIEGL